MSGGWQIFLFLFILGVVLQSINTMGIWSPRYPNAQYTMEISDISEVEAGAEASPITIFVVYAWIVAFVTVIVSGLVAVISLNLLFYGMGWPVDIVTAACLQIIQTPATLIAFAWVFELWTGRPIG